MADSKLSALYVSNPITVEPEDLLYAVDDPGGTPASAGFKASQLMHNRYRIVVTISSNDLVVSLKHLDGTTDPSSTKPLYIKIGNSLRIVSAATSITVPDGTNWFNSGSAELGTLLVPYFPYAVWDSNSSVVALTIGRKSHFRLVSDTSATTTNESHIYNYANFTTTDDMVNIGYFEATLSLTGTGHLWTVPTFTSLNLRHEPTYESNIMTYVPTWAASGTAVAIGNAVVGATYQVGYKKCRAVGRQVNGNTTTYGTGIYTWKIPFTSVAATNAGWLGLGQIYDTSTATTYIGGAFLSASGASTLSIYTHSATSAIGQLVPVTVAVSDEILFQIDFGI